METYFKLKIFAEFGTPIIILSIIVLIIFIIVIKAILDGKKIKKIKRYMESKGYEYYLRDVASCGDKTWWAYRKDHIRVDEDELYKLSFRKIKKKFK